MYKVSSVNNRAATSALVKLASLGCVHQSNFSKIARGPGDVLDLANQAALTLKYGPEPGGATASELMAKSKDLAKYFDMGNIADPETLSNIGLAGGLASAGGLAGLAYKNRANATNPGALARLFGAEAKGGVDSRVLGALAGAGAGAAGLRALPMIREIGMDDIRAYREASNAMAKHVQENLSSY
jgi:hypothetical protein